MTKTKAGEVGGIVIQGSELHGSAIGVGNTVYYNERPPADDEEISRAQWEADVAEVLRAIVDRLQGSDEDFEAQKIVLSLKDVIPAGTAKPFDAVRQAVVDALSEAQPSAGVVDTLRGALDSAGQVALKGLLVEAIKSFAG